MSLKLKQLLPIFALALGIGLALLIPRVKAFAYNGTDGDTKVGLSGTNFGVETLKQSTDLTVDYVDQFVNTSGDTYYSTMGLHGEYYIPVSIYTQTTYRGLYVNGRLRFNISFTVSASNPSNYLTISSLKYTVSLVNGVGEANAYFNKVSGSNNYSVSVYFDDFPSMYSSDYITLVLCVNVTGVAQWSGSGLARPNVVPLTITPVLSGLTDDTVGSSVSFEELRIRSAIDSSVDTQGILDQLITANAHMVWSDGAVVYDVADLLWMINGNQMTANSTLQNQYNQDTITQGLINQILSAITTDTSGISQSANDEIDNAHDLEEDAQVELIGIIESIDRGSYPGIGRTPSFDDGLASISNGINGAKDLLQNNSNSINFWKVVGDTILDSNHFGMIATFLCIVLILGFTVWVLRL